MKTKLEGKVVLVTGAGQGIGRGIAHAFADEGARIVVSDINKENADHVVEELKSREVEAVAKECDVSSADAVHDMFVFAQETFGGVDVVVNNAGIFPFVSVEEMTEEDWEKVMNVNLKSIYLTSKEALKALPEGGRIVTVSSVASLLGFEGLAHYCASKSGMNGFVRALALETAKKQITVNAVAPGAIDTPGAQAAGGTPEEGADDPILTAIPLARRGKPEDIASVAVFLASEQASYITGQIIPVDGGWTLR